MRRIAIIITLVLTSVSIALELKQSTAEVITVGPFMDITDGTTRETALTVTGWTCQLFKNDANSVITITASDGDNDAAHLGMGRYSLELTTGNTDTLGDLAIEITDVNACPVWRENINVIDPNEWDRKYSTGELKGLDIGEAVGTPGSIAVWFNDISSSSDAAEQVWEDPNASGPASAATIAEAVWEDPNALTTAGTSTLEVGTVATGNTKLTFTLSAEFTVVADAYPRGTIITITDVTDGNLYMGRIRRYTSGRVVTLYRPLPITPANGDAATIWPMISQEPDL